jgi:hypothetical protein
LDSRWADSSASAIPSADQTTFMPRPPPPNAAFSASGQPWRSPNATAASGPSSGSTVPGTSGALACSATRRAATLSPMAAIAAGLGPTQRSPASITAWAKPAFSARKP